MFFGFGRILIEILHTPLSLRTSDDMLTHVLVLVTDDDDCIAAVSADVAIAAATSAVAR